MKSHPILFSAPMVRALLDGTKTQTRRVITKAPAFDALSVFGPDFLTLAGNRDLLPVNVVAGDTLWVRESWRADKQMDHIKPRELHWLEPIFYEADKELRQPSCLMLMPGKLRPSIFMPSWASRIALVITEVKVQRLQDINEVDAIAEGCRPFFDKEAPEIINGIEVMPHRGPQFAFERLWDGINAKRGFGWSQNPWVAAYTFEVTNRPIEEGSA